MFLSRAAYFLPLTIVLSACFIISACDKAAEDPDPTPPPFEVLPEDSTGYKPRSITYVYDHTVVDPSYPPKIDSSVFLFSYDVTGKIDSIRLIHNDSLLVYDFSFERLNNKLTAMHCVAWTSYPYVQVGKADIFLEYNSSGNVSLMKANVSNPANVVDTFFIKSTGSRIDTVIDGRYNTPAHTDKYAFTYNGAGDITQIDYIFFTGVFWSYVDIYKYTYSGVTPPLALGNEAIYWNFFAHYFNMSSTTGFMIPPALFQSSKQTSKQILQVSGYYTGTSNYQTQYYNSGRPKKMTASVITETGAFEAREAYYYTYGQ